MASLRSAGLLAWVLAAGCGVELEHGLDERQANQVASALEQAGIAADKLGEDGPGGRYKIVVGRGEAARAFAVLESHDLPRAGTRGLAETFAGGSLVPSAVEERARLGAALSAELERTLEALTGVTTARVHLALPAEDPLVGEAPRPRPTASVLLKTSAPLGVGEADIRKLVAGAVHTLSPDDVSVVIAPGAPAAAPPPLDRLGPLYVAHESRATLAALATSGLAVILLLSVAVMFAALRLGTLRRRVRELQAARRS
jgi:type III secretion protein J